MCEQQYSMRIMAAVVGATSIDVVVLSQIRDSIEFCGKSYYMAHAGDSGSVEKKKRELARWWIRYKRCKLISAHDYRKQRSHLMCTLISHSHRTHEI